MDSSCDTPLALGMIQCIGTYSIYSKDLNQFLLLPCEEKTATSDNIQRTNHMSTHNLNLKLAQKVF